MQLKKINKILNLIMKMIKFFLAYQESEVNKRGDNMERKTLNEDLGKKDILFKDSKMRMTQKFGANQDYYSQFGLKGHEGIDCVPQDLSDWSIYSPSKGKVYYIQKKDSGVYGKHVCIYYKNDNMMVYFCHMKKINIKPGKKVKMGEKIGVMGNTGNSYGAHVHMMGYKVVNPNNPDYREKYNNGFKGMIDLMEDWWPMKNVGIVYDL